MKIIVTILSTVLLFSLSACGSSEGSSGGSTSQTQSQIDKTTKNTEKDSTSNHSTSSSTPSPSKNTNSSNEIQSSQETFYGQWQIITSAASNPNGETYSTDDWNNLKGKKLTFSKDSATCFGDKIEDMNNTVSNPVYKKTVLSDQDFQTQFRVPLNKLPGIQGDSITEVDVTGTNGICNVFFTTQYNNMLILYGGGEFFVLEPPNLTPSDVQAVNEPKGAWVDTFKKNLFKNYHVIPSRFKSIGNGNWEVWVREVNTGEYGYVTVNQNTGDFHG